MRPTPLRTRTHANHASDVFVGIESLEARCLLTSAFNPDGPTIATPGDAPTSIITADFDGDSKPDLVMSVGKDIIFQKGGGGGRFGAPRVLMHLNTGAGLLGVGDFNNDGINDLFSVEQETFGGWYRLLLNNGQAQFSAALYGRTFTAVESVTVGNIDSDAQDEVLLKGRSPIIFLGGIIAGEVPDEIRVLDPRPLLPITTTGQGTFNLLPFLRFNDLGIALRGQKLAAPVIANLLGGSVNNIITGGEESGSPNNGWIQVYAFADPNARGGTLGLPPQLFNPASDLVHVSGVVSSVGAANMEGDSKLDIVATTLTFPVSIDPNPSSVGSFGARTLVLPRTGLVTDLDFGTDLTVETRTLAAPAAGERRTLIPEYRIATLSDINSDGLTDVGLSIVQEFVGGAGGTRRVARFVQAIHSDVVGVYGTLIVAQLTARGGPNESAYARPQIFHAADVRRVGRPDLIIAMPQNSSGFTPVSIRYNVPGFTIIPF